MGRRGTGRSSEALREVLGGGVAGLRLGGAAGRRGGEAARRRGKALRQQSLSCLFVFFIVRLFATCLSVIFFPQSVACWEENFYPNTSLHLFLRSPFQCFWL